MDEINLRGILDVAIKTTDAEMTLDYALFVFKVYRPEAEKFMNGTLQDCPLKKIFNKALAVFKTSATDIKSAQKILKAFGDETLILLVKESSDVT